MNVPKLRFKEFNDEWSFTELAKISSDISYGMGLASKEYDGVNKYIRITDIDEATNKYSNKDIVSPDGVLEDKYLVNKNDILFARTGASTGKTYLYDEKDGKLYFAGFLIRANIVNHDANFIFQQTKTYKYNKWVKIMSMRSGQPGINSQEYGSYKFSITSSKEEEKISKTLNLLDKKIELQTKKIEDLKLFTFNTIKDLYNDAKCDTIKIQDIATFYSGGTPKSSNKEFYSGTIPFIRSGEIHSCKTELYINEDALIKSSAKMISKGDILYALYGATSGDVSISKITGAINQAILCIKPNNNINKFYLYQVLKIKKEEILKKYLQGGQGNLSAEIIKNILIKLPSPEFQNSISKISNNLEIKLEMEMQKLNKLIELKKGLMQNMFV